METRSKKKITDDEYKTILAKPHKSWCFTLNNHTKEEVDVIIADCTEDKIAKITIGEEIGEEGTPHLQGAVTFRKATRFSGVKKLWSERIHWEVMIAVWDGGKAAFEYCKKDGNIILDIDNTDKAGKRTDLDNAYDAAGAGHSLKEYLEDFRPNYQAIKVFEIAKSTMRTRDIKEKGLKVSWIWGESGCGKTRMAESSGGKMVEYNGRFWMGYDGEKTIILDDIKPEDWRGKTGCLLKALDRYPFTMEVKGGSQTAMYETVIITCIYEPEDFWKRLCDEPAKQLLRRITEIIKL